MKTILTIFAILTSLFLRAEYRAYHITFNFETVDGQKHKGYTFIATYYLNLDSLNSTDYLKRTLNDKKDTEEVNKFYYFENRLKYEFTFVGGNLSAQVYYLTDRLSVPNQLIKSIKIIDLIDDTYARGISSELKLSDTVWMKKQPIESISFGGYFCDHQIFIHTNTKKIDDAVKRLELKQKEIDNIINGINEEESNSDEVLEEDDKIRKIETQMREIINGLKGQKVVVITTCTC